MGNGEGRSILIRLSTQALELLDRGATIATFSVSTSANGAGESLGSERTPRGKHRVKEMIGAGAPLGTVFVERRATGEVHSEALSQMNPTRDWILTRIIWLEGMEEGRNKGGDVDTFARYIYIHGTSDDQPMGIPKSHGCIRMRNEDVVTLFDNIEVGTEVQIEES